MHYVTTKNDLDGVLNMKNCWSTLSLEASKWPSWSLLT